jgi:hypothetical protein
MSQQFSAVIMDVASIVGTEEYSGLVKSATYSNAVMQVYSPDTGSAQIQANSVDGDVAGTPDSTSWYNAGAGINVVNAWEASAIIPICAKYLRVVWFGTAGDLVKVVITLQG